MHALKEFILIVRDINSGLEQMMVVILPSTTYTLATTIYMHGSLASLEITVVKPSST